MVPWDNKPTREGGPDQQPTATANGPHTPARRNGATLQPPSDLALHEARERNGNGTDAAGRPVRQQHPAKSPAIWGRPGMPTPRLARCCLPLRVRRVADVGSTHPFVCSTATARREAVEGHRELARTHSDAGQQHDRFEHELKWLSVLHKWHGVCIPAGSPAGTQGYGCGMLAAALPSS